MINSPEYIGFCKAAHEIMPKLAPFVRVDYFYDNLDILRKEHKIIKTEFECFQLYPRHNMAKFHEAVEVMGEFCKKTDVQMIAKFPTDVQFNEDNWSLYRHIKETIRYIYEGIDISKLIDFTQDYE